jgi:HAD superfamily hydrolase (TIGR01509 family)
MPVRTRRHWIFDLDGTLTLAVHDFDGIRRSLGLPVGVPILEAIARLDPVAAARTTRQLDTLELALAERARPQPEAQPMLAALQARGCRLGIVTRNSEANAAVTLRAAGLAEFFAPGDVIGRESCAPKPSPDGVVRLLAQWYAAGAEAVMVGDYLYDLQAGRAAGTGTVLFDPGAAFRWREHADLCIDRLAALTPL